MAEYIILAPRRLAFWDLARQCRAEIDIVLDTGLPAAGWKLLGALLARGRRIPVRAALCNVNNQGVIDEPEGSLLPILELGATANLQGVSDTVMLYSATVQRRLNLTLRSPWHSAEDLDRLFGAVLRHLDEHGA